MGQRILVVDDEEDIIRLVRRSLEMERYEVCAARDGEQALSAAAREQPDLILLDVNLPRLDGFEVCQRLRGQGYRAPVIMLTGCTTLDHRVRGLDCGADDYVGKPFDVPELIARVRAQLRRVEDARQAAQQLIRNKWEEINEGLRLAQSLQQPFRQRQQVRGLRTAVHYVPVGRIGGDFYNLLRRDDGQTVLLIGDAVGKGLGASLLMASTFSLLSRILAEDDNPARVFAAANQVLRQDFTDFGLFVAAFLAIWNPDSGRMTYCNAGHQAPMLLRRGTRHRALTTNGFFLGAFEDGAYENQAVELERGDRIWMFTDGLADLRDRDGRLVDVRRVYRRLLEAWDLPVDRVVERLLDSFGTLAEGGVTMRDDLTAMLVEIADD
jgi:sigma-B regulation protein RsbU (phosphoserine phosphatase)